MSRLTDAERDGITDRRRRLKKACVSREGSIIVIHQYFDLSHVRNGVPDIINSDDEHFYRQAPNDIDALLREVAALKAELAGECKACGATTDRLISQDGCVACEMLALRKDADRYRHLKNKRAFRTTDAGGGEHRSGHYWEALVVREPAGQTFDDAVDDSIKDMP